MVTSLSSRRTLAALLFLGLGTVRCAATGYCDSDTEDVTVELSDSSSRSQKLLKADAYVGFANLPLKRPSGYHLGGFTVEVGVGTPPQMLDLKVEIGSAVTYVRDEVLSGETECKGDHFFSSRSSTSFRTNNTRQDESYLHGAEVCGIISEDAFRFGPLQVPTQRFLNADYERLDGAGWDGACGTDGVIGLSDSGVSSEVGSLNPIWSLAENLDLDAALFGLRIREPAELSLGRVNETLFTGDITRVPLNRRDGMDDTLSPWQVRIDSIDARGYPGFHCVFGNFNASFTTTSAFSYVPPIVYEDLIQKSLGFEQMPFLPPSVDCAQRVFMPNLTFTLADRSLTITPFDYTLPWAIPDGPMRCVTSILPLLPPQDTAQVILGSAFLQAFYSVFDFDSNTIGFATLSQL